MVRWRQLLATGSAAAVTVGLLAVAPVVAEQRASTEAMSTQVVGEAGGIEMWGWTSPSGGRFHRASYPVEDGPWVSSSSRNATTNPSTILAVGEDGILEALPGSTASVANIPANVAGEQVLSVSVYGATALAVTADGEVHKWGGGRGIPDRTFDTAELGGAAVAVEFQASYGVVRLEDGSVATIDASGVLPVENFDTGEELTGVTKVVAGGLTVRGFALREDGSVVQIDLTDGWRTVLPADASDPIVDIAQPEGSDSFANLTSVTESGRVLSGSGEDPRFPADQGDGQVVQVAAVSSSVKAALTDQGNVVVWGSGSSNFQVPAEVANATVHRIEGGTTLRAIVTPGDGEPEPDPITVTEQPTIAGDAVAGETLTATPAEFSETEGVTLSHQWYAAEGEGEPTLLDGEDGTELELTSDHVGQTITYTTTGQRGDETPVVSDPSNAIGPIEEADLPDLEVETQPSIALEDGAEEPRVGATIEATPATFSETSGLTIEHRWFRDGEQIEGANTSTYTLANADIDAEITYVTHAVRSADGETATSEPSNAIGPVLPAVLVIDGQPTIGGQGYIGIEHTVEAAPTSDDENAENTYLWTVTFDDEREPVTAEGDTFTPGEEHRGGMITVTQTATRGEDTDTATSVAVGPVRDAPIELVVETEATIEGTPRVGQTVTATGATFSDPEVPVEHFWVIDDTQVPAQVDGNGQATLELTQADHERKTIRFRSVATREGETPVTSTSTSSVGPVLVVLASTGNPEIGGTPQVGQELRVSKDATFNDTQNVTVAYRWLAGTQELGTGKTLRLTDAHVGQQITVEAVATRGSDTARATSAATSAVTRPDLTVTGQPQLGSQARVGTELTARAATFSATDGVTIEHRWFADGVRIEGADGTTFTPRAEDLGKKIGYQTVATRTVDGFVAESTVVETAAVLPEDGGGEPSGDVRVEVDGSVGPGATIPVHVGTDYAGQDLRVYIGDRSLGTALVGEDGRMQVTIPGDLPLGEHLIAVYDADGQAIGMDAVTVLFQRPGDDVPRGEVQLPEQVRPGQVVDVHVGADYAGHDVRVGMFSAVYDLGTFEVAADGFIRGVTIPADIEAGVHRVAVYDLDGNVVGWQDTTVLAADGSGPGGSGGSGGLPGTGADSSAFLAPLGLAVLLAGAVTMGAAWRRRGQLNP